MLKKALPTLVLAAAVLGVALLASQSPRARFSNLQLPADSFDEVYLQMKTGSAEKCLVGGRGRTTSKRSEGDVGKASWRCRATDALPASFLAESKLEPSFLFVPVTEVNDPAFPWAYERLHQKLPLPMPAMRWVHLFHNRQFRGLYLEVQLPARAYAAAGNLGRLELLAADPDQLICFDRKMRPLCPIYNLAVADGVFPEARGNDASRRLFALAAATMTSKERLFVLSDQDYGAIYPLPLPFSLRDVLPRDEAPYRDQRYARWWEASTGIAEVAGVTETASAPAVGADLENRQRAFVSSLTASCQVMDCDATVLAQRLGSSPSMVWLQGLGG